MNAERLLDFLTRLQQHENAYQIQNKLQQLVNALSNLQGQPANSGYQTEVAKRVEAVHQALSESYSNLTPAQASFLEEIGGDEFYTPKLSEGISAQIAQQGLTPSVAFTHANTLLGNRQTYLHNIEATRKGLATLGVKAVELQPGEAEIGFLIPRSLFKNHFDELLKKLGTLNRIIGLFSELATGKAGSVDVRQISSTDPMFFFGLEPESVAMIGAAITWGLHTWKQVLDIREVYGKAKEAGLSKETIEKIANEIQAKLDAAVVTKVNELMHGHKATGARADGRTNELTQGIKWSLESIVALIERGMTVEVRAVPPPKAADKSGPETDEGAKTAETFSQLQKTAQELVFPAPAANPVVKLPPAAPPGAKEIKDADASR